MGGEVILGCTDRKEEIKGLSKHSYLPAADLPFGQFAAMSTTVVSLTSLPVSKVT
jgi:hypothetical protein